MTESILRALSMAFAMGWEKLWPLILGFTLSGVVQAVGWQVRPNRAMFLAFASPLAYHGTRGSRAAR